MKGIKGASVGLMVRPQTGTQGPKPCLESQAARIPGPRCNQNNPRCQQQIHFSAVCVVCNHPLDPICPKDACQLRSSSRLYGWYTINTLRGNVRTCGRPAGLLPGSILAVWSRRLTSPRCLQRISTMMEQERSVMLEHQL